MENVAIIIPCYNVADFLPQCLDSVLRQTHNAIQAYVVDDCSTDATPQIIREYAARDTRITGIYLEKNSGVSAARNAGIEQASEPWCIFVDGDDALPDDAISQLIHLQEETGAELVCANTLRISENGEPQGLHYRERKRLEFMLDKDPMKFLPNQEVFCTCWNKLFPTDMLKQSGIRFNLNLRHAQDTLFTHEFLLRCRPHCVIDYSKNVYLYRQRASSCVHAIQLEKRLAALKILVTAMDSLATELNVSRRLVLRKAAEYLWAIRKFTDGAQDRRKHMEKLVESTLFKDHLAPILTSYGKFRHRAVLKCISLGWLDAIRFW